MSDQFMDDYKRDTVKAMADRIQALEAALRNINDICHDQYHEAACMAAIAVARAALASSPPKATP